MGMIDLPVNFDPCRLATASKPGGSPMDAQVGGAPVAPEAVQAAAHAAKTAPTSFAPSANPGASKAVGGGSQGGSSSPQRAPSAAGESKAQPTASTPSAAELEKAAQESRISQGAAARCACRGFKGIPGYNTWLESTEHQFRLDADAHVVFGSYMRMQVAEKHLISMAFESGPTDQRNDQYPAAFTHDKTCKLTTLQIRGGGATRRLAHGCASGRRTGGAGGGQSRCGRGEDGADVIRTVRQPRRLGTLEWSAQLLHSSAQPFSDRRGEEPAYCGDAVRRGAGQGGRRVARLAGAQHDQVTSNARLCDSQKPTRFNKETQRSQLTDMVAAVYPPHSNVIDSFG